ncbi:hypothetical protein SDC9_88090 [bioreactor metagenome]|uniref:Uncharacterized protein n=1 Tax=bioreactor metagenome TaxID=1076179 RepID=A0A644ZKL3_9ZZZZ
MTQGLELTGLIAGTAQAVLGMIGEDELVDHISDSAHLGGIRVYHHALANGCDTGGLKVFHSLHLHHADTAGAVFMDVLQVAEVWNVDPAGPGGLHNGGPLGDGDGFPVDGQLNHTIHLLSQCRQRMDSAMALSLW